MSDRSFWQGHTGSSLVAYYNDTAPQLGFTPVKKFTDRATAERRCEEVRAALKEKRMPTETKPAKAAKEPKAPKVKVEKVAVAPPKRGEAITREHFATVRAGSKREKLTKAFLAKQGQHIPLPKLAQAIYGDEARIGPVGMVLKGFNKDLKRNSIPAEVRREKEGKAISFGLFPLT